jgi:EAL domain-containing protein (putative c-di-GMP-specific phosphodiesterase class I)
MLREADTAMYHAKAGGRGRLQVFDEPMRERALSQLRLEADLRRALERGELSLVFQPILSFPDEVVTGFEALARWHHPELGLILPDDFIPVAEETGLILPIGRWVLGEACAALAGWQRRFGDRWPVAISVNLSPRQFAHPDLVQQVGEALAEAGIDPSRLELEITEQVFIDNPEPALRVLDRLREMGVGVCVDDFGTGYSSLSYLSHFRFDVLKIDRTFVHRIDLEDRQRELVGAIIELAAKLGIQVVAEGVETDGQLDRLKTMSCPYMQGFRLGKPLLADEVSALLAGR